MTTSAFHFDHHTQTVGTVILEVIQPQDGVKPRLTSLVYTPGATAHDLVFLKALNQVLTTAAAAAAATSLVLDIATFAGDTIASGDYLVVEHADGTYGAYLASALSTLTVTIGALAKAVNAGAKVFIMGNPTDSYHQTFTSIASTRTELQDYVSGIADGTYERDGAGDPALIYSANATNAGTLNRAAGRYVSF
jgi:hypothetical protein